MPSSNSKEWFEKAEIDYFAAFVKLWLSFNALYKRLYQNSQNLRSDRDYIEELKNNNNVIMRRFIQMFSTTNTSTEAQEFKFYLQELFKAYGGNIINSKSIFRDDEKGVKPQMNRTNLQELNFSAFIHPNNNRLKAKSVNGYIKIERLFIQDNGYDLWPYLLEIIYMVRCMLVHGVMDPTAENHKLIQSTFIVLRHLIKEEV